GRVAEGDAEPAGPAAVVAGQAVQEQAAAAGGAEQGALGPGGGDRHHPVGAGGGAQGPGIAGAQRGARKAAAVGGPAAHAAQVAAEVAVAGQLDQHQLAGGGGAGAGTVAEGENGGDHGGWGDHPADAEGRGEDLAGGAQVDHHVRGQGGEQRERGDVVA